MTALEVVRRAYADYSSAGPLGADPRWWHEDLVLDEGDVFPDSTVVRGRSAVARRLDERHAVAGGRSLRVVALEDLWRRQGAGPARAWMPWAARAASPFPSTGGFLATVRDGRIAELRDFSGRGSSAYGRRRPVTGVSELVLEVVDLEAAEAFYAGVLGLPVVERWPDREAIWVMAGDRTRIGLWRPQVGLAGGRGGVHVHFAMKIAEDDYDAAVGRLRGRGQEVEEIGFSDAPRPRGLPGRPGRQRGRAVDLGRGRAPARRLRLDPPILTAYPHRVAFAVCGADRSLRSLPECRRLAREGGPALRSHRPPARKRSPR